MAWKFVKVLAWVEEDSGTPPGIWGPTDPRPTPPINLPPGYPGNPPGIWGPNDPRPQPPIHLPPEQGGGGGAPPHPEHPIPPRPEHPWVPPGTGEVPPDQPPTDSGAHPEHPIYYPPGIWGPNDPRPQPPIHLPPGWVIWGPPGPWPTPPIHLPPDGGGEQPPTGGEHPENPIAPTPEHPIYNPDAPPAISIDDVPPHPDLPDTNAPGEWTQVQDGSRVTRVWVVLGDTPEGSTPVPPEQGQPGTWLVTRYADAPRWAWEPSVGTGEGGGEQPEGF